MSNRHLPFPNKVSTTLPTRVQKEIRPTNLQIPEVGQAMRTTTIVKPRIKEDQFQQSRANGKYQRGLAAVHPPALRWCLDCASGKACPRRPKQRTRQQKKHDRCYKHTCPPLQPSWFKLSAFNSTCERLYRFLLPVRTVWLENPVRGDAGPHSSRANTSGLV